MDPTTTVDIVETLGTSLTTVSNQGVQAIATVLPAALIVTGAIMVITIGYKVYRKFAK